MQQIMDNVNHPQHYETGKFECIEVIKKAVWYLNKYIELEEE